VRGQGEFVARGNLDWGMVSLEDILQNGKGRLGFHE
jgi:hypothetical protein